MVNTASFKRYVEVGRVGLLNKGESEGQLAVIVEIIDHNRAVIDNPSAGVARQVFQYRDLTLTPYLIKGLPRGAGSSAVKRAFDKAGVAEKWAASSWAKKRAALVARRGLSDFGRFELRQAKAERRRVVGAAAKSAKA
ncbi:hypothetical protein OC846_003134 [Tilletia horrida]|uniref:Large ribosomal subunit protein eL14 domain-containing protein n=1 Tax=Tilletia horrida TaxID=155126 RepID=A0AAN6GSQ8_9BASI|nr:hypothetical protein OC845_003791 [Tilletia horrida]KAK0551848.1 hypothetical protein OC846_003134 [Tilletia horrida]KAK0562878.1 hypothetical protein OC861_005094 [Tilletia horrida]